MPRAGAVSPPEREDMRVSGPDALDADDASVCLTVLAPSLTTDDAAADDAAAEEAVADEAAADEAVAAAPERDSL